MSLSSILREFVFRLIRVSLNLSQMDRQSWRFARAAWLSPDDRAERQARNEDNHLACVVNHESPTHNKI